MKKIYFAKLTGRGSGSGSGIVFPLPFNAAPSSRAASSFFLPASAFSKTTEAMTTQEKTTSSVLNFISREDEHYHSTLLMLMRVDGIKDNKIKQNKKIKLKQ